MNLSKKVTLINEAKLRTTSRATLNPNAAEFIPFSLRSSSSGNTSIAEATARFTTSSSGTSGKAVIDQSKSFLSNNSDEEDHQYWHHQLPDDITPDFTPDFEVMGEDASLSVGDISLAELLLNDNSEASRFPASIRHGYLLNEQKELSKHNINSSHFTEKARYAASSYGVNHPSSASFLNVLAKPWEKPVLKSNLVREGPPYDGNSRHRFMIDMLREKAVMEDDTSANPLDVLALQFPSFAAESLEEVYFSNGCNLNLTIEMLAQLELQVDGGFNQNPNSKLFPAHSRSSMDLSAVTSPDGQNDPMYSAVGLQESCNPYCSSNKDNVLLFKSGSLIPSCSAVDFASSVKKFASQDLGIWNYDRNGSSATSIGSSISSHITHGRGIYGDGSRNRGSALAAPASLETGDAVANMYSEQREEALDHAHVRNTYFEQAREAYIIGNEALAKELNVKGQLHNMHTKAAHGKAKESIYFQRNQVASEMYSRGQERVIDLHGLHVTEAIHVLKHELSVLMSTARAAEQRLQVYIFAGKDHHNRSFQTPAGLSIAVQRYLLEQGLVYTEPQPGLLRVVIY